MMELRAHHSLLYIAGSRKQNKLDVEEMWGDKFAPNIFRGRTCPPKDLNFLFLAYDLMIKRLVVISQNLIVLVTSAVYGIIS